MTFKPWQKVRFERRLNDGSTYTGTGKVVACIGDYPVVGCQYAVLLDEPPLDSTVYAFPAIALHYFELTAID